MDIAALVTHMRSKAGLSQRDLARLAGTSQPGIARLERGRGSPTFATLERLARAAGFELQVELAASPPPDPVIEAFKRDIDRTLLLENLKKSVDQRLRLLAENQEAIRELRQAVQKARRRE